MISNSDVILNHMYDLIGDISTLTTKETIKDIQLKLDDNSKNKLAKILLSKSVTRENQDIMVDELTVNKEFCELIQRGQDYFIQHGNTYSASSSARNPARFSGKLQTVVPLKSDIATLIAIEISLGNFSFDFDNSRKEICKEIIIYENVKMTIFPSSYSFAVVGE